LATPVGAALNAIRQPIGERPSFNPTTAEVRYTIATTDYAEATVLPRLLPILKRSAPQVTLQIKRLKGIFDLPVAELELCDCALGFFPLPLPPGAGINGAALFNDRFVGMLRKRHPMRNRKLTLRRFLSLEHIRVNYSEEGPGLIGDAIQKMGHRRNVRLIVPHLMTDRAIPGDSIRNAGHMRLRQRIIMGSVFVVASASVALGQARGKAEDALLAADVAWEKVYAAKDLAKAVAFCDEHASMSVPDAPVATGKEAFAKAIASDFAQGDTTWHPDKVGVALSGELGYTSGMTDLTFIDASDKTVTKKGNYLTVWKKDPVGSCKVLFDSFNYE
jgi:ketosteroid isomerase-like protein